jgi:hypothetical protein
MRASGAGRAASYSSFVQVPLLSHILSCSPFYQMPAKQPKPKPAPKGKKRKAKDDADADESEEDTRAATPKKTRGPGWTPDDVTSMYRL